MNREEILEMIEDYEAMAFWTTEEYEAVVELKRSLEG